MDSDPLRAAVNALCNPRHARILRDAGTTDIVVAPSLIEQLREARASNGAGDRRRSASGGSPLDLDVLDILDRLRVTVADWRGRARLAARPTLEAGVRQIAAHDWPDLERAQLGRILGSLVARAEQHLTPPDQAPERHVRDTPCPECGEWTVAAEDPYGDPGQVPAVVVVLVRGQVVYVACQACGKRWDRAQLESWASVPA